jgi:iron complex transport system substrate-binding protein
MRIVSMAPSLTECLFALGAGDRLTGVTSFCNHPAEARNLPRIGGYTDANYERIYSLQPDLVLLLDEHFSAAGRLDELGIPYIRFDTSSIPAIFRTIETLGRILDEKQAAATLTSQLRQRMEAVMSKPGDAPGQRVLVSIGRNMGTGGLSDVYVAGPGTLYHEMLEAIGAENVYTGKLPYAKLSHEAILRLAPDVVIDLIPDLDTSTTMSTEAVRAEWNVFGDLPAVVNRRVHVFGGDYVCVPGPRFVEVLEDIAYAVYPNRLREAP